MVEGINRPYRESRLEKSRCLDVLILTLSFESSDNGRVYISARTLWRWFGVE